MFIFKNPNTCKSLVGDCVVRAISIAEGTRWWNTYLDLCTKGYEMCDMPSSNEVWGEYLKDIGYHRYILPMACDTCYSVEQFCKDYPTGLYILATGTHVITVIDGDHYDTWNSKDETPIYYWQKEV